MAKTVFWFSIAIAILFTADCLYSQRSRSNKQVIVELEDGGFIRGWIITNRTGQREIIDLDGQATILSSDDKIFSVSELEKEFRKKQRNVKTRESDKTDEYVKLLEWAQERQLYESAYKLARKIVRRSPANPDAKAQEILSWARKYMKLSRSAKPPKNQQWSRDDVQKIRFALLPTDRLIKGLRITFRRNLLKRFVADMKSQGIFTTVDQIRKFNNSSRIVQAQIIKKLTGNKYQHDIIINSDPPVMLEFRRVIVPLLNRTCANIKCHGGGVSEFKLIPNITSTTDMYANFYLLDSYKNEQGEIINHQQPSASLLLQYLLPASQVKQGFQHPVSFKTPIKTKADAKYQRILQWIHSLPKDKIDVLLESQQAKSSDSSDKDKKDSESNK